MSDELTALKSDLAELAASMKANHLLFAKGLAEGKSQEQAWKDAGSKSKNANADAAKTISNYPAIIQYKTLLLKIVQLELLPKQIGTIEQKRKMLWDIAQRCVQEIKPKLEGHGEDQEIVGYVFDSRGAIGAIAELNKMDGDLAAIKTDNKHTHELEDLTDEQLTQRIANLQRKVGAATAS